MGAADGAALGRASRAGLAVSSGVDGVSFDRVSSKLASTPRGSRSVGTEGSRGISSDFTEPGDSTLSGVEGIPAGRLSVPFVSGGCSPSSRERRPRGARFGAGTRSFDFDEEGNLRKRSTGTSGAREERVRRRRADLDVGCARIDRGRRVRRLGEERFERGIHTRVRRRPCMNFGFHVHEGVDGGGFRLQMSGLGAVPNDRSLARRGRAGDGVRKG